MNQRERWLATMHFQPVDHVPDREFGYWVETLDAWHAQGFPAYVTSDERADIFFGFEGTLSAPLTHPYDNQLIPPFEYQILEKDDRHELIIDTDGAQKLIFTDGRSRIPKFVKFPIETREDWLEIKRRLDPAAPGRFPQEAEWEAWKARAKQSTQPLQISVASLFGRIRDWMGFENVCYAIIEAPAWVEEMIDYMAEFHLELVSRAVREVKFDVADFWEDICFNSGPILPPNQFEKWMVPRLKQMTGFLAEHGCDIVFVDCDGNINDLVELWLEGGVNCMFPLEVRANTDAGNLRERFGHRVLLMGGVDKMRLIAGKEEIRKEVARIKPVVEDGGYMPHLDHRCPPDVTYENYLYYLKVKRDTFGIPEPEPWEARKEQYEWARDYGG